ncbi:MAG: PTS sugar transporter subunit IIA [Vagococcus fluvialis]|uniref:PTS sugar transporter subunit IIA n=1 Tax=Vagococcus fluvialis TaxID=2738 RepID=UPI000A33E5DA|nr:fructose PTS transporter subunit IIA [Vagococcus fluvialis]MBO0421220.1 PTS sugar transporter subunit IIA [Vagococcus fluvialis]OTP31659.1 hypothetical protein A5798_001682 [Enterococcus sp. 6C8_DIV0013]
MSIVSVENIKINQNISSQQEVFEAIARLAQDNGYSNSFSEIIEGLDQREAEGSTGMMDGIAIPHCQSDRITHPGVFIFQNKEGIEWQSMDGKPVKFIVSLLIPKGEAGTTHLKILSTIARMLMKEDIKNKLLQANSREEIYDILKEQLSN